MAVNTRQLLEKQRSLNGRADEPLSRSWPLMMTDETHLIQLSEVECQGAP